MGLARVASKAYSNLKIGELSFAELAMHATVTKSAAFVKNG